LINPTRYLHTLRYLRPVQIYGRIWFKLYRPKPDLRPASPLRGTKYPTVGWTLRSISMLGPERFRFLKEEGGLEEGWNPPGKTRLWIYNLHYFDDLNARDAQQRNELHHALISRWIRENPPGKGPGWEPYPLSLRMVNWIKWLLSRDLDEAREAELLDLMAQSLAVQARFLERRLEHHLRGNHLIANAKALVLSGLFFSGDEPSSWYEKGIQILCSELSEQILSDGGHFERSPMYHSIILEDILDLINIHTVYGCRFPESWTGHAAKMLWWLYVMSHPDGDIVLFNDAAFGIAPSLKKLEDYASALSIGGVTKTLPDLVFFQETGYARACKKPFTCFFDVAPIGPDYQPGHAHADTLSFEMSVGKRRVFVDTGASSYEGPDRLEQRQTKAHNTLTVDNHDSSEVWGNYRVARRAKVTESSAYEANGCAVVRGVHDGFSRLSDVGLHERKWIVSRTGIEIRDKIDGAGTHLVSSHLHLHPDVKILDNNAQNIGLMLPSGLKAVVRMDEKFEVSYEPCKYHPEFGVSLDTVKIVGKYRGPFPTQFQTRIYVKS